MKDLINTLLDGKEKLLESFGSHGLAVEKKLAEKRVKDLNEGIVPDTEKDSEEEVIKKLTERPEDRRERPEDPPMSDEEPSPDVDDEDNRSDAEKEDEELDKEYLGKKEETYYYLTKGDSDEEGEGRGAFQVIDQEGKIVYTSKDSEADSTDIFHFIVDAVRDIQPDDVSYDIFVKYVVPKIEELEKEQGEYADEEINDEEPPAGDREEDRFREAKEAGGKNLHEIRVTFDRREFDVKLVDENSSGAVIEINGKRFDFSPEFSSLYKDESGNITEDKLEELALGALSEMDKAEFDDLVVEGPEHIKHEAAEEACGTKHKKKYMKEAVDVVGGVKDLVKSAADAIKDYNFVVAAELCQRLATIQQALPMGGEEEVMDEAPPSVDDEEVDLEAEAEDETKAEVEAAAAEDDEEENEGIVPGAKDSEGKVIDKLEEKTPPTCPKCSKAHWPFHKCDSAAKADDSEEEKSEDKSAEDEKKEETDEAIGVKQDKEGKWTKMSDEEAEEEARKRREKTEEGIVPDTEKDSEEEVIKKLTEMCDVCNEDPCACKSDVEDRLSKKKREF